MASDGPWKKQVVASVDYEALSLILIMGETDHEKRLQSRPPSPDDVQSDAQSDVQSEIGPVPAAIADDIPDGGWIAWLQVAGAFALFFNSW